MACRADRNGHCSGRGVRGGQHVAAAIENSAGINNHAGGMDLAGHYALGLDFDATLRENHAVEAAGNDHVVAFDLSFHF